MAQDLSNPLCTVIAERTLFFILLLLTCLTSRAEYTRQSHAATPPRGWNSYDSYSWIITEEQFLRNAELVRNILLPSGYEYVVIDFLWYRKLAPGVSVTTSGYDTLDEWGRPIPDPDRWPSSAGGLGFKPIADKVHAMGLKFGIHVMRGISTEAVKRNTPVLGAPGWRAADIALQSQACSWMSSCFVNVNEDTVGGEAFIQSLYDLYASWGVDFVKHDCVFGANDLDVPEIVAVSKAISATGRPMVYSLSPGVRANPAMGKLVNGLVNMYRITNDDWDSWSDLQLHFDVARDFAAAGLIGAKGLLGLSWPDLDMLPLGYLTDPGANQGPHRFSKLTLDEQRTQVTLWAMVKSPLMFGGDMPNLDKKTLELITNPVMLTINAYSYGNKEIQGSSSIPEVPVLKILECENAIFTRWNIRSSTIGSYDELCWASSSLTKGSMETPVEPMGCLNWTSSAVKSMDPNTSDAGRDHILSGHIHLSTLSNKEVCLDASATDISNFSMFRSKNMVSCSFRQSQAWVVNHEGKLISESTGLCAVVTFSRNGIDEGNLERLQQTNFRTWAARGPSGEYYIAFFNLGSQPSTVSIPTASIVGGNKHDTMSELKCSGQDVWSSQNIGIVIGNLSAEVPAHGCSLFSLLCN